ncbi:MAG: hypothetical protein ABI903_07755 [Actinomycetota bacterium]
MPKFTRKTVAVAATLLLFGGGAAFAYWTTSGSGSGTATTGTNNPVTINQTTVIPGMYPGQAAVTLAGTFNNSNPGNAYVTAVTAPSYAIDAAHVTAGCTVAQGNYVLGGTATITGNDVAPGTPAVGSSWTGLTIQMVNLGTNQDACKGATVTITYASS